MYPFSTVILCLRHEKLIWVFHWLSMLPCWFLAIANKCKSSITPNNFSHVKMQCSWTSSKGFTYIMSRHSSKVISFSNGMLSTKPIYSNQYIPAISRTTASISEITIFRVPLPVKKACFMWTNIRMSASSDDMELRYPYCKLQRTPSSFVTIICALVWASIFSTARNMFLKGYP